MTEPLAETANGTVSLAALEQVLAVPADVIAAGPGLGGGDDVRAFMAGLLDRAGVPLVLDADALNAFALEPGRLSARGDQQIVVTPHPGEMARLLGIPIPDVQAHRLESARNLATTRGLTVVLKGHRTVVAGREGKAFINPTGNAGMATGGTGDVLTGMVAAWLAQTRDPETSSLLAVYLHGAAGDLAADDEGQASMTAGDLAARIGDAVQELTATRRTGPEPA